jgi:ubiquinone/menaquinone biosynthesis C-methylase UbiE
MYTRLLSGRAREIVVVDFSEAAILRARSENNAENIRYVLADIQNLNPFPQDTFQKVVAIDVLEHLTDDQLDKVLIEVNRVLSGQGLFILFTPCRTHWIERLKSRNLLLKQTPGHIGVRTEKEIRDSLQRSGLQVKEVIRYETCIPVLRLLERHLKKLPPIGNHFVSRLGISTSKTGRESDE